MSVSFRVRNAPMGSTIKNCEACDGTGKWHEDEPCPYCSGSGKYECSDYLPPFFDLNLADGNARDFLYRIRPERRYPDLCGEWADRELEIVHHRLMVLLNSSKKDQLVTDTETCGNVTYVGRDDEYVTRRLSQLLELVTLAKTHGFSVLFG